MDIYDHLGNIANAVQKSQGKSKRRKRRKPAERSAPRRASGGGAGRLPKIRPGHIVGGYDVELAKMREDLRGEITKALASSARAAPSREKRRRKGRAAAETPFVPKKKKGRRRKAKRATGHRKAKALKHRKGAKRRGRKAKTPKFQTRAAFLKSKGIIA